MQDKKFRHQRTGDIVGQIGHKLDFGAGLAARCANLPEGIYDHRVNFMLFCEDIRGQPLHVLQISPVAARRLEHGPIHIHGQHGGGATGQQVCQIPRTRSHLQDDVIVTDFGGVHDRRKHERIDHKVLTEVMFGAAAGRRKNGLYILTPHCLCLQNDPADNSIVSSGGSILPRGPGCLPRIMILLIISRRY